MPRNSVFRIRGANRLHIPWGISRDYKAQPNWHSGRFGREIRLGGFLISREANSRVYVPGRYEVQIYDSFDKNANPGTGCGGIYPRCVNERNENGHSPRVCASRPVDQWQTFDFTFRAPRLDGPGKRSPTASS
jgi:hypothetical protein